MKDELFDTPQKIEENLATLKNGMETPFWILICKMLDGNIEFVKQQLENGTGEEVETPESINRTRDKLKLLREFRNTPENTIRKYDPVEGEQDDNPDPFDSVPEEKEAEVDNKSSI